MDFIKRLFGGTTPPAKVQTELDKLEDENLALGKQIDEIREQRRQIKARADALRAQRDGSR